MIILWPGASAGRMSFVRRVEVKKDSNGDNMFVNRVAPRMK